MADGNGVSPNASLAPAKRSLSPAEYRQRIDARMKHGLRAKSGPITRRRYYRVRRLEKRVYEMCAWLTPLDGPAVRRYAEAMMLAVDGYAAILDDPQNERLHQIYRSHASAQLEWSRELGLTPRARIHLIKELGLDPKDADAMDKLGELRREFAVVAS